MAVISRLTFADIETEVTQALGNPTNATIQSRIQKWITPAYTQIALTWKHYELDTDFTSAALSVGDASYSLPADCYINYGASLLDPDDDYKFLNWLSNRDLLSVLAQYSKENGKPHSVARHAGKLFFDRPLAREYKLRLLYYKTPTRPDFAAPSSSVLHEMWDDVIILWATAKGHRKLFDYAMAELVKGELEELLIKIPQVPLLTDIVDRPTRDLSRESRVGAQG